MKKTTIAMALTVFGVFGVVRHLVTDVYHVAKYQVVGVVRAVKHAGGDAKTVAK